MLPGLPQAQTTLPEKMNENHGMCQTGCGF